MLKLPYIEPTIRTIAGGLVTAFTIALIWAPENIWLWFFLMMFVSLNLFQSGFSRFCLMEKLLERLGLRSEMAEIQRLGEQNQLHRETLDILNETVIELTRDTQLVYRSNNWESLIQGLDQANEGAEPLSLLKFVHPDDRAALERLLSKLDSSQIETLRFRIGKQQETERWVEGKFILCHALKTNNTIRAVLRDISEYYIQEKRIAHMAMHDALTGLPNRILLDDRMDNALIQSRRTGKKLAVMFIDLDNFKQVNDIHGHKAGDQLLIAVSTVLKNSLRQSDTLARWGGDEFVILLPNLEKSDEAKHITEELMQAAKEAVLLEGLQTLVTLSIGISLFPDNAEDAPTLLIQADQALFYAKSQGRNNFQLYDAIRRDETFITSVDMNIKLAVAIRNGEIQVHYQPVISAVTGKIINIEAFARWHDHERGWISPSIFIPMAENLGLIHELSKKIQEQALHDLILMSARQHGLKLSLNISNHLLAKGNFARNLSENLLRLDISPSQLQLEISESATHLDIEIAKLNLRELADMGFGLALDDFGTGFSSRSNLHEFPFSEIKIDISFIRRIKVSDIRVMVKAIIEMAHAMKYTVVAEGVEDKLTADTLMEMGVEKLQGNYFYAPASVDAIIELISKTNPGLSNNY